MSWDVAATTTTDLGIFRIYVTPPGGDRSEVTLFRNIPTEVVNYGSVDPFGDSTAQIRFPQISALDELGSGDLFWFTQFADIDITLSFVDGTEMPMFEGYIVSYDWAHNDSGSMLTVTARGALYQVDNYVSFPEYPSEPIAHEVLIAQAFSPHQHADLRTRPLVIEWPQDWAVLAYRSTNVVGSQAGQPATGFKTRVTGGWEKTLTGFVQNLLQVMYTSDFADQWTIRKDPGRQPVMYVRTATRVPDFTVDAGAPGVDLELTRDYTQFANVIYGSGTSLDGSQWTRQTVAPDTNLTSYVPMAADPRVYPDSSALFDPTMMKSETYIQFENGMEESTALKTAQLMLRRNQDPGFSGTITLTMDPNEMSRFEVRAGMTLKLRYFAGMGGDGINLHITECQISVSDGTAQLTVDSKYRDALTVAEALARTRDPLTPIKMLQVGKQSILIPDQLAPWSYALGSGFFPKGAMPFFDPANISGDTFPYDDTAKKFPPRAYPNFYVPINAAAASKDGRWASAIPIRMAEKGTIRLTQVALYDRNGNRLAIPFHISFYKTSGISVGNMPMGVDGQHSPFIPGAFLDENQFGLTIPAGSPGNITMKDPSLIIGWGTGEQPAGYSPGTKTNGDQPTGLLIDETEWAFDLTDVPDFQQNPQPGFVQLESAISIYAMVYAEYHDWVYAIGRLYYKPPGV